MINTFQKYCNDNQLFNTTDKILLTVSGGRDSVFMVHLFFAAKIDFGIAHCNFNLRGEGANLDEQFVKNLASKHDIPFYVSHFNTKEFASKNGISIQMAARELRYTWFEQIRKENNYDFIATAHHKNDVAETMLINLTKGTGLAGLHGISNKKGEIIRPILCFSRKEIDAYITKNNIEFREDKSNTDTKYLRNNIRHNIIPELEKINPQIINTLNEEAIRFKNDEQIIAQKIKEEQKILFSSKNEVIQININKLKKYQPLTTYIYYFFKTFGFNWADANNIANALDGIAGKKFASKTHQLLIDRKQVLIAALSHINTQAYTINNFTALNRAVPFVLTAKIEDIKKVKIEKSKNYAFLAADKIKFPLTLRKWKKGDVFQPFGMKGKKKLSDFFVDEKLSLFDKESVWLLTFNTQIVWIVGYRIDDNFKLTSLTKEVLILNI